LAASASALALALALALAQTMMPWVSHGNIAGVEINNVQLNTIKLSAQCL